MSPDAVDDRTGPSASGDHERHLALSTAALQASQVVVVLSALAVVTVLARRLTLPEFGTYGLLLSLTTYVLFVQASVETAAVKAIAEAAGQPARDRAFSTALSLYATAGLGAGLLIAGAGTAVIRLIDIPAGLHHQAQLSVLALGAVIVAGWPLKVFQDVLRGNQLFAASALSESTAYVVLGATLVALALARAPLWLLVAGGASMPIGVGALSAVIVRTRRLPYRYRRAAVGRESVRSFLGLSSYLFLMGIADFVIYSLDRLVLGIFRPVATVGLYEGPIRAHNLIRQIHGSLTIPVVPAAARYLEHGDAERSRDLLVRGTRYTLAVVVPITIVLMVLAKPILTVWLGPRFAAASTAMILLAGYWLVNANTGVAGSMAVAAGKARSLSIYAAAVAAANLTLSLALTPSFGLNGVVLATSIAYVAAFPFFLRIVLEAYPVRPGELAREAWLPAYSTGAVIASCLIAVRVTARLDTVPVVLGAGAAALLGYWVLYYLVWLRPNERRLLWNVAAAILRR